MENIIYFMPDIILILGVIISIVAGFKIKDKSPKWHMMLLVGILFFVLVSFTPFLSDFIKASGLSDIVANFISFAPFENYHLTFLEGSIIVTPLNIFFKFLITISALVVALMSLPYVKVLNLKITNFLTLYLIGIFGAFCVCVANDFLSLFVSAQILSISLCFLITNFNNKKEGSKHMEAGVKYLIADIFSGCFMLFAISYIYLHLGTLNFSDIGIMSLNRTMPDSPLLWLFEALFFASVAFKICAFPFYMWIIDVFKGSNYAIGLFISSILTATGAITLVKTASVLGIYGSIVNFALILCSVLTIISGTLLCTRIVKKEGSIKDFLASNTILNAGYVFLGVSFLLPGTIKASILYLIAYLAANFGLWAGFMLVSKNLKDDIQKDVDVIPSLCGMAYISPSFATLFSISLLSLAGFPFMAGFSAKFYLLTEILRSGVWAVHPLLFVAFAGILSVYCSFKIMFYMFSKPESLKVFKKNATFNKTNIYTIVLALSAIAVFALFVFSTPVVEILNTCFI